MAAGQTRILAPAAALATFTLASLKLRRACQLGEVLVQSCSFADVAQG